MIPKIGEAVIETVNHELEREGVDCLVRKLEELAEEQPLLYFQIAGGLKTIQHQYGVTAAESAVRLATIVYKMIEAQIEIEELENNHE